MPPPPRTGAETVAARADIQRDWADREFIQKVQFSYVKVATFLNKFDIQARYKLGEVFERLTRLERQMELLEQSIVHITGIPAPIHQIQERPSMMPKEQIAAAREEREHREQQVAEAVARTEQAKLQEHQEMANLRASLAASSGAPGAGGPPPRRPVGASPPPPVEAHAEDLPEPPADGPFPPYDDDVMPPPPSPPF